jgi:hypothetical protein|nr:MAG TPA: RNAse domain protein [Caudoviricetes sp.]
MQEDKVQSLMFGITWETLAKWLRILQKGNQSHCPWCNSTKWLIVTKDSEQPSIQAYPTLDRIKDGEIIKFSKNESKLSDLSVIMRCANCGFEQRFNFFHLCQRIQEEMDHIKAEKEKKAGEKSDV